MSVLALLMQLAPSAGTIGAVAGVAFLLLLAAAAFVAFKALKKTVGMAIRLAIVGAILFIAAVGSLSLWYFSGSDAPPRLKPPAERRR